MSCVCVLTPIAIATWPVLAASVTAAIGGAGFQAVTPPKRRARRELSIEVEGAEVLGGAAAEGPMLAAERDGVRVVFATDPKGRLTTTVSGALADEELRRIGQDLAGRVLQQYVYRHLAVELSQQGFVTVEEEVAADAAIRLRVRRYEE